ncbi:hypothetical protein CTAYLR_002744 [Chrysophaeum taylorii]|uniref:snRNA-activating protein complex subunit 3 n=1 Tax=Chrysophaeum taylorii TaxID=2483200 RepID=A0AAD7UEB7_9STRA|nr:hypothetical protein CTAYLR_002744 [Chrysophaeum taylorii]
MVGALDALRKALSISPPCPDDDDKMDVRGLTEELPEAQIETAIEAVLEKRQEGVPLRNELEASLLRRGAGLSALREGRRKTQYATEKGEDPEVCRRATRDPELVFRFTSSSLSDDSAATRGRKGAVFQVLGSDTLGTLATLIIETCATSGVAGGAFSSELSDDKFDFGEIRQRFADVEARLGLGQCYAFRHGTCVHELVLTRASLWTSARAPPRRLSGATVQTLKSRACDVCAAFTATTLVNDDPRCGDALLFCDQCLHMFYYDLDGRLLDAAAAASAADDDDRGSSPRLTMFAL